MNSNNHYQNGNIRLQQERLFKVLERQVGWRKNNIVRALTSTQKESNTPTSQNDNMIDNQSRTVEGNDDDIRINKDQNNIFEHLDQPDPSSKIGWFKHKQYVFHIVIQTYHVEMVL